MNFYTDDSEVRKLKALLFEDLTPLIEDVSNREVFTLFLANKLIYGVTYTQEVEKELASYTDKILASIPVSRSTTFKTKGR